MKNIQKHLSIIILTITAGSLEWIDGSGRDTNTCTNLIAGNQVQGSNQEGNCGSNIKKVSEAANAVGDRVEWNLDQSTLQKEIWGSIARTETKILHLPKPGDKKLITLIPTEGIMRNKKIEILIVPFDKREKIKYGAYPDTLSEQLEKFDEQTTYNSMVKFYRRPENEASWTEIYELFTNERTDSRRLHYQIKISAAGLLTGTQMMILTDDDGKKYEAPILQIDLTSYE